MAPMSMENLLFYRREIAFNNIPTIIILCDSLNRSEWCRVDWWYIE